MEDPEKQNFPKKPFKLVTLILALITFLLILASKSGLFSDNPIPLIRYLTSESFAIYPLVMLMAIAIFYVSYENKEQKDLVGKDAFKNYFPKTKIIKVVLIYILTAAAFSWLRDDVNIIMIIFWAIPVPFIMVRSFFAAIKPQSQTNSQPITASSQPIATAPQPIKKKEASSLIAIIPILIGVFMGLLNTPLLGVITGNPKDIPPIQFKDGINDFKNPPNGGYPPNGINPFPAADMKNIAISNSDTTLTIKYEMNSELIRGLVDVERNDPIVYQEIVMAIEKNGTLNADLYKNPDALLMLSTFIDIYTYPDGKRGYRDYSNTYYLKGLTGPEVPRQYKSEKSTNKPEPDFSSFPPLNKVNVYYSLSELGLKKGDKISFRVWSNIETTKWKHYSFDVFPEVGNKEFTIK